MTNIIQQIIAGAPAKTRDGREAKYVHSYKNGLGKPINLFTAPYGVGEEILAVDDAGRYYSSAESPRDILLSPPEPVKGWIAVAKMPHAGGYHSASHFHTDKQALSNITGDYHIIPVTLPSE
jgi:hypothetical protein